MTVCIANPPDMGGAQDRLGRSGRPTCRGSGSAGRRLGMVEWAFSHPTRPCPVGAFRVPLGSPLGPTGTFRTSQWGFSTPPVGPVQHPSGGFSAPQWVFSEAQWGFSAPPVGAFGRPTGAFRLPTGTFSHPTGTFSTSHSGVSDVRVGSFERPTRTFGTSTRPRVGFSDSRGATKRPTGDVSKKRSRRS